MKLARLFLALCFILVGFHTYELSFFSLNQNLSFDADEAHHASRGLDVYDALRQGSPSQLYTAISDQSFYPPLHSLTVAAAYATLGGPSLVSSRVPSWIAFILSLFVTALAVRAALVRKGLPAAKALTPYGMGTAMLFGFFSPLSLQNASVCMLEALCMLATAGLLYILARNEGEIRRPRTAILLGIVLALAILAKYTLLIFVVAPALLAIWGIPILTPRLAHKTFFITTAIVSAAFSLWLALSHWEGVWYFLFGFPKRGVSISLPALLTQPRMFIQRCALYPELAIAALLLSLLALQRIRDQRSVLFSFLCVAVTLAILGVSRQQGGRFMLHALPCVWFLCGLGIVRLCSLRRVAIAAPWLILLAMTLAAASQRERLHADILRALETTPATQQMLELVKASANSGAPILQIGSSDRFNIESVRWTLSAQSGIPFRAIIVDQFPMTVERLKNLQFAQPWRAPYDRFRRQIAQPLTSVIEAGGYKTLIVFEGERWLRQPENTAEITALMKAHPHKRWTDGTNALTVIQF